MSSKINYSFIIPHHNTPDLLSRLIDSIPQRDDIEIIVIDDNSDVDKKAHVIRPDVKTLFLDRDQTKGAGKARNIGIDESTGKWLLFADSDDFYKEGFISVLDEYKEKDIDFLFFSIESVDSKTLLPVTRSHYYKNLIHQYDGSKESSDILLFFSYTPWMRMFNAAYIKKYGIRYEETIRANDIFFSLQASYFAKQWEVDQRSIYVLTYFSESLTAGRITKDKYRTLLRTVMRISKLYAFIGHPDWNKKSIRGYYSQSPLRIIYNTLRRQPALGLEALLYYLAHWFELRKSSNYYVDIIKSVENNNKY